MNLASGQVVGKYTAARALGSGSFGTVYLMHDNLLNRDVAVKFVENKDPTAFIEHFEAQIMHQCRHERIVAVNSVDILQNNTGKHFVVIDMEFVQNGSAQSLIETEHVTIRRATKITIDTLIALEHAHRQNVLHRDVKPANIMLSDLRAKLSDFGLATTASASLTASGAGSPVYCAPEVINDNRTTIQTDLFAVGMSLFQLANNISNIGAYVPSLDAIKMGRVISTIGYKAYVPRRLRLICNKACSPEPDRRYASAHDMRQALEALRVKQDWTQTGLDIWTTQIGNQHHEMTIEEGSPVEMVYRINGRRRNAYCFPTTSVEKGREAQQQRVYRYTF